MNMQFQSEDDLKKYIISNVLTVSEACEHLGISKQALGQKCKSNQITPIKGHLFWLRDLDDYLNCKRKVGKPESMNAQIVKEKLAGIFRENCSKSYVEINSKKLHDSIINYTQKNRMPVVCAVMQRIMQLGDEIIDSNNNTRKEGIKLTIRYKLPRQAIN